MSDSEEPFREMTASERAVMDRLLSLPFPDREAVAEQVRSATVRSMTDCQDGLCLELATTCDVLIPGGADGDVPLAVEGRFTGPDGIPVEVMLFHRQGKIRMLEFVVYGEAPRSLPTPDEIEVLDLTATRRLQ